MTKKEVRTLLLLGITIIFANLALRLLLRPLPENLAYLIKTLVLGCGCYFLVHRRLGLRIKSTQKIGLAETLRVCWLIILADFIYISGGALGISKAPHMIGTALIVALGAGFLKNMFFVDSSLISPSKMVLGLQNKFWGPFSYQPYFLDWLI